MGVIIVRTDVVEKKTKTIEILISFGKFRIAR